MTGIYFDAVTGDWAISVEAAGGVCGYAATAIEAAQQLSEEVTRWERYHRAQADRLVIMQRTIEAAPATVPATPVIALQKAVERESSTRAPCPWYRSIRRFYAIAQERHLDTRNDAAIRAAIGRFWSIDLVSRQQLSAGQWQAAGDAVKLGALSW
jgi:hypothetical protein